MAKDQTVGWSLLVGSIITIIVYIWLLWWPFAQGVDIILLKLTGTIAVIAVFGILGWIGYTLATTPPPKPIEEIEKELEEELKKLEKEETSGEGEGSSIGKEAGEGKSSSNNK